MRAEEEVPDVQGPVRAFFVPGQLPGLNDIIASAKRFGGRAGKGGARWNAYAHTKVQWTNAIRIFMRKAGVAPVKGPCYIRFTWREGTRRRDPDNVAAGGRKLILDAMVAAGVLENDGWSHIEGWSDTFLLAGDQPAGVEVHILPRSDRE